MPKTTLIKSTKYLLVLVDIVEVDKVSISQYKIVRKNRNK